MRDFIILADADCEMTYQAAEELGIGILGMPFMLDGTEYVYDLGKTVQIPERFLERLKEGAEFSTSCPAPITIKEFFQSYLDQGLDILYIGLSNKISMQYNNCVMMAQELMEENPEAKIICIDSLSISIGQAQLIVKAAQMKKAGKSLEETAQWVEEHVKNSVVLFVVDDLNYLKRGGRLSGAAAFLGTMLDLKPLLHTSEDGRLEPIEKIKGRKKALHRFAELLEERQQDIENETLYIAYSDEEEGKALADAICAQVKPKEVVLWPVGPVIGGHAGPGAMGIAFFGSPK